MTGRHELGPGGRLLPVLVPGLTAVVLGAPLGLLWQAVSPRPVVVPAGQALNFADSETKAFIAADALLFLLGLSAGVLLALVFWRWLRQGSMLGVVALCAGGLAGAYLAGRVGVAVDGRDALVAAARAGTRSAPFELPIRLRAWQVLLAWPGGSALALALLVLLRTAPEAAPEAAPVPESDSATECGPRSDPGPDPVSSG